MSVKGNGGSITTNKIGHLKNYGDVWFDERAITNILWLKNVKQKHQVTYNSSTGGVFTVHKPGQLLHLVMHKYGLHYRDTRNREITLVQTVQENKEGYSQRQIQDAKKSGDLYAKVGYPSTRDFQKMISQNLILNCPVTMSDVDRADKIYGKYIHALKGKSTRSKPKQVVIDYMEIPKSILKSNKNITLSIDIIYVNKIPFIVTISRHVKFTTVKAIQRRTKVKFVECIKNVAVIYTQSGFKVENVLLDGEFVPLRTDLLNIAIAANFST